MQIDIWSDVVCPFCYIGKRKLELALAESSIAADIVWHSFELNPDAPPTYGIPLSRLLADKYGMGEARALEVLAHEEEEARKVGLDFRWQIAKPGNTFNAHRLIHLGKSVGIGDKVNERFLRGYFTEGQEIGDPAVLRTMAVDAGLDPVATNEVLAGDRFADAVRADEAMAGRVGIRGVPFFIFDGEVAVYGAQPVEQFVAVLKGRQAAAPEAAEVCADGVCEVPR